MNIPKRWPAQGHVVDDSGTYGGGCSEVAGGFPSSWRKLGASRELPGAVGHPAMPGQIWIGSQNYSVCPTEQTSFLPPKRDITSRTLAYYLLDSTCEL